MEINDSINKLKYLIKKSKSNTQLIFIDNYLKELINIIENQNDEYYTTHIHKKIKYNEDFRKFYKNFIFSYFILNQYLS